MATPRPVPPDAADPRASDPASDDPGFNDPGAPPDVVVVGAGPAGAITALVLARRGLHVLLLDRAAFPRPKPCGDCLSAAATDLLDELGLLENVLAAGANSITHWCIASPGGRVATGRLGGRPALALERRRLDPVILDAARRAGARFRQATVTDLVREGDRVRGVCVRAPGGGEETVRARLVVGADGLRSVVARRLGRVKRSPRLRKVSLTAHVVAPAGLAHGEMHVLEDGCLGFAPAGNGRCNLSVVVSGDATAALRELGPHEFFRQRVLAVPAVVDRLPGGPDALRDLPVGEPLASGPFDWPSRGPAVPGAALVGDAAGYYDPFTGQGIYQAMAGGRLLAAAVAPVLEAGSPDGSGGAAQAGLDAALDAALRQYAAAKRRLTRPARRVQRGVELVVSRPWLADPVLGRLAGSPAAMDRIVEVTGDVRPPRSLLSPAVVSSLVFPRTWRSG